jgi:hypothetical protein
MTNVECRMTKECPMTNDEPERAHSLFEIRHSFVIRHSSLGILLPLVGYLLLPLALVAEPCQSGPQCGQRPGPYAFLVATGPKRGQAHCYICETGDRPAVIVFARTPNDLLGKFLTKLDQALAAHKAANPNAWVTFLSDDQPALEPKLIEWSRKHGLANIPVGVFEDNDGPPSYRLSRDAEVTILLAVNQKVVVNFALRAGELTEEKGKEILEGLPKILGEK